MSTPLERAGPGIAERWFGIGALKPPTTEEIRRHPDSLFPMNLQLGEYKLSMEQQTGKWTLLNGSTNPISPSSAATNQSNSAEIASYKQQIADLQRRLALITAEKDSLASARNNTNNNTTSPSSSSSILELEQRCLTIESRSLEFEKRGIELLYENNQLRFKNRVLMAMAAISEGDYKELCKEAGIEPKERNRTIGTR